jgi:hypothetical protein
MTPIHRFVFFAALLGPMHLHVFSQSETPIAIATEGVQEARNYIDASWGLALIEERVPLPGASVLFGRRVFRSETMFVDGEVGLALPSVVTGKLGLGKLNPSTGRTVTLGIRPFPSHLYIQFGKDDWRCGGDVKPRTIRRLNRRGKDVSDLLCGESAFSIEGSAFLFEKLLTGQSSYYGETYAISFWSSFMVTWSHRWYLH